MSCEQFEFRAVGASQNVGRSCTTLNAILADSLRYVADEIEKGLAAGLWVPVLGPGPCALPTTLHPTFPLPFPFPFPTLPCPVQCCT